MFFTKAPHRFIFALREGSNGDLSALSEHASAWVFDVDQVPLQLDIGVTM